MNIILKKNLLQTISIKEKLLNDKSFHIVFDKLLKEISKRLNKGGKIFTAGNGGSAADAQHLSAELVSKFKKNRDPIPSIALTTDTSIITSISNDFTFKDIFVRQIKALYSQNDILIAFSTSGESKNIIELLKFTKKNMIFSVLFTGLKSSNSLKYCDISIRVPSNITPLIQECHICIYHSLCEILELSIKK